MYIKYNDNELLYLIGEHLEEAQDILFEKYQGLIYKRLKTFRIKENEYDDFYQEGLIALYSAINSYDSYTYNKSFNKYFDLLLQRRFIRILKEKRNEFFYTQIVDDIDELPSMTQETINFEYNREDCKMQSLEHIKCELKEYELKPFEHKVILMLVEGHKPKEVSIILDCKIKKIYNALYRTREKVK